MMKTKLTGSILAALTAAGLVTSMGTFAAPQAVPSNFADEAFKNVWTRTDALVDSGAVKRSYFWGPTPGFKAYEEYAEGPNGQHLVQYFDKSRMELNNPAGDKTNPFYVTNGLLTRELISGQMQTGNNKFTTRYAAEIDIASDTDDLGAGTPTYASFTNYLTLGGVRPSSTGIINETISRVGAVGIDSRFGNYNVHNAYYEMATSHNIPDVFWQFLNASGPVIQGGKTITARLNEPYFYATGYPLTEAYWASVKIAGVSDTAVLVQPYERRVLTYVPSAPEGFKVQMGNIGQHYYSWRYQDAGKPTPLTPPSQATITASPVQNCTTSPVRGFGTVWANHTEIQTKLGCTFQPERAITVTQQNFEHGQMITTSDPAGSGYYLRNKSIYVLFEDGSTKRYQDTYVDGAVEPQVEAPRGLYAPVKAFGKLWREGTGDRIRDRLGWATAPQVVATAPGAGGGAGLELPRGAMIYSGPATKKIYVLYTEYPNANSEANHWLVFDDTYREP